MSITGEAAPLSLAGVVSGFATSAEVPNALTLNASRKWKNRRIKIQKSGKNKDKNDKSKK